MSTMLVGFHFDLGSILHPCLVASWIMASKQYLFPESILSWFQKGILMASLVWMCSGFINSGSYKSLFDDTLVWSTNAFLHGMGNAISALSSWWFTSESPELLFNPVGDPLLGVFFLLLQLFLLGIAAFKIFFFTFKFNNTLARLKKYQTRTAIAQKRRNQKVVNLIPGQYVT